jgi:hypothetical protein
MALAGITPHVWRQSFASTPNDLGFTEVTIAAMLGQYPGSRQGGWGGGELGVLMLLASGEARR